jgi:hypothetical protein
MHTKQVIQGQADHADQAIQVIDENGNEEEIEGENEAVDAALVDQGSFVYKNIYWNDRIMSVLLKFLIELLKYIICVQGEYKNKITCINYDFNRIFDGL